MGNFAIRNLDTFGEHEHYVGTDAVLWDWLMADNAEASPFHAGVVVQAPEGYVFNEQDAVVVHVPGTVVQDDPEFNTVTNKAILRSGHFLQRKALMLMKDSAEVLTYVSADEFSAYNVDESRIVDVHFFYQ